MTTVAVYSYTHSVTYVADNILKSLKDVLVLSGLDPARFVGDWGSNLEALTTWLRSEHLERVSLEIYDPKTDALITRWDIDIVYQWSSDEGSFWTDTDQLRYTIKKKGLEPSAACYRLLLHNKEGRPDVPGWGPTKYRATTGMVRQTLGSTIEHHGLGGSAAYWRKI